MSSPNGVKSKRTIVPPNKKYNKKMGGRGGKDDDDSSVDSKNNIRNLIDYDYSSEDESYSSSEESYSPRPKRKAAILARKKISKVIHKEQFQNNKTDSKKDSKDSKTPKNENQSSPSKRKYPFKGLDKKQSPKRRSVSSDSSKGSVFKSSKKSEEDDSEEEYDYSEEETEEEEEEYEESEESEEESEQESDDESEGEVEDENEEDEDNMPSQGFGSILLTLGQSSGNGIQMIPKKYNMKKEPEIVKKFVKLLTTPVEENTIDTQITQFKGLNEEKQKELIVALENRPSVNDSGVNLMLKILTLKVSPEIQAMILAKYNSLQSLDTSSNEYFKLRAWLDKAVSIPFGIYKDIPVRLDDGSEKCAEFIKGAKKCLDNATFGQDESKLQILQFISTKIANPDSRGLSLLLIGPPGVGKTSIIKNGIAKALGWPFQFISLGGDSDASTYTGHQLVYESSHCGKIVNSLVASK
jgi:ATP-dependent Lon protease